MVCATASHPSTADGPSIHPDMGSSNLFVTEPTFGVSPVAVKLHVFPTCGVGQPGGSAGLEEAGSPFNVANTGSHASAAAAAQIEVAFRLTLGFGSEAGVPPRHPRVEREPSGACRCDGPHGRELPSRSRLDGAADLQCHNPALGCASSLTCGVGRDKVVGSRSTGWVRRTSGVAVARKNPTESRRAPGWRVVVQCAVFQQWPRTSEAATPGSVRESLG
jgi:hypothetical protein